MDKFRTGWIKNRDILATTANRNLALDIAEAGLTAINTESVILNSVKLQGNILSIAEQNFDLSKFKTIKVVGFGKASIDAASTLEKILDLRIKAGVVIGLHKVDLKYIETFAGTHPRSSQENFNAGKKIFEIIKDSTEEDLIIVLVSGGGSALLCYPESECEQGARLYDSFLNSGKTINEINTVRKHLSLFKGGGLAKIAYPATIIGLIFSDIPGNNFGNVASGPTYKDESTIADAEKIGKEKYFEKVHNFVLVSNEIAVNAMARKSEKLGLKANIISTELYDEVGVVIKKIFSGKEDNVVVLAAGEPSIKVKDVKGKGGRSLHMGLETIAMKEDFHDSVFMSLASDGMDNSDSAGAVVDKNTIEKAEKLGLNANDYLDRFDSYNFFDKTGDMIMTGPTGANVSDLMILVTKK